MNESLPVNEVPTIKERLENAQREIIRIATNDFIDDCSFKRANQALCARIKHLEDASSLTAPRFVSDTIPGSNLAKYGHYQYNEGRERTYTPSASATSLLYSCSYKWDLMKEPWMLPEVEQVFIHTIYASSYNFNLYEMELEHMDKLDFPDEEMYSVFSSSSCANDYQKVNSVMDQLFERSPSGKASTECSSELLQGITPHYFNVSNEDDVILRDKIMSETIRKLWEKPNLGMKERVLEMYKSSMDNMFFNEDENMNSSLKSFDHDLNLQKLVSSIIELNHKLPKKEEEEEEATKQTSSDAIASESTVPHRRLYSDVVQGNRSNLKSQKQCSEPLSPKSDAWSDDTCTTSARSCSQSCASSVKNFQITASCTDYNEGIPIPGGTEADLNRMAPNLESSPTSPEQPEQLQTVSSKSTSMKYTYSDAVNSSCGYSVNQYNLPFLNDISAFDTAARTSSSSTNFQNVFNPLVTNTMYSANYRVSTFPAPTTNYTTNANFVNPQLQLNRPPMATSSASNQCQQLPQAQQPWIVTQYRPTPYSVLLLPQLPTKHRWTNPHFVRPPTPPSTNIYTANASGAQTWPLQSANRTTNAAQAAASMQPSSFTLYETLKKSTKVSTSTNAATTVPSSAMTANLTKFSRSRTPEPTSKITQQPFAKPRSQLVRPQKLSSSVFRVPTKQEKEFLPTRVQGTVSCRIGGHCLDDQVIPINCSASDDLEKIALLEYHSSNDIFFSEIERQAKEQYDGNPENYCRPPSKGHLLAGGLLYLTFYTIRI